VRLVRKTRARAVPSIVFVSTRRSNTIWCCRSMFLRRTYSGRRVVLSFATPSCPRSVSRTAGNNSSHSRSGQIEHLLLDATLLTAPQPAPPQKNASRGLAACKTLAKTTRAQAPKRYIKRITSYRHLWIGSTSHASPRTVPAARQKSTGCSAPVHPKPEPWAQSSFDSAASQEQ